MPRDFTVAELAYERTSLNPRRIRAYVRKVVDGCLRAGIDTERFDGRDGWTLKREVIWRGTGEARGYEDVQIVFLTIDATILSYGAHINRNRPDQAPVLGHGGTVVDDRNLDILDRKAVLGPARRSVSSRTGASGPKEHRATHHLWVTSKGEGLSRALSSLYRKVPAHLRTASPRPSPPSSSSAAPVATVAPAAISSKPPPAPSDPREATGKLLEHLLAHPPRPGDADHTKLRPSRATRRRRR